jgi:3-oxoacid CoA-transferase subunit B
MAVEFSHESWRAIQAKALTAEAMARRAAHLPSTKVIEVRAVGVRGEAPGTLHLALVEGGDASFANKLRGNESLVVMLPHIDDKGRSRLSAECITSALVTDRVTTIITNLALIAVSPQGLVLKEVAPGLSAREIQAVTELPLFAASDLAEFAAEPPQAIQESSLHD